MLVLVFLTIDHASLSRRSTKEGGGIRVTVSLGAVGAAHPPRSRCGVGVGGGAGGGGGGVSGGRDEGVVAVEMEVGRGGRGRVLSEQPEAARRVDSTGWCYDSHNP